MSLAGGTFVPTNKDKKEVQIDSGKSFKIGNSLDCDWILEAENGGPVYCELCIDNFGRVSGSNAFLLRILVESLRLPGNDHKLLKGGKPMAFESKRSRDQEIHTAAQWAKDSDSTR